MAVERLGVPAVGVMTSQFVSAAELMARVLGADGFRFAVIEHPISSASEAGLRERAAHALSESVSLLLARG